MTNEDLEVLTTISRNQATIDLLTENNSRLVHMLLEKGVADVHKPLAVWHNVEQPEQEQQKSVKKHQPLNRGAKAAKTRSQWTAEKRLAHSKKMSEVVKRSWAKKRAAQNV